VSDEAAEIIPRPPSSPIGSTLLIVSTLGLILAIAVVWMELFGEYLPTLPPGVQPDPEMAKHVARKDAENHTHDHYAVDYPGETDVLAAVERDLGVGSKIGDLSAGGGAGAGDAGGGAGDAGGGGEAPRQPEAPDGGGGGGR
jgi:hypothetical protein